MASLVVLYWRDIPSQVIAGIGRRAAKRALSDRFLAAIDAAAMRAGATSDEAYLAGWRRGAPVECGDDWEDAAQAAAARIEAEYDAERLAALAESEGREAS
jgi:hypothetical protein